MAVRRQPLASGSGAPWPPCRCRCRWADVGIVQAHETDLGRALDVSSCFRPPWVSSYMPVSSLVQTVCFADSSSTCAASCGAPGSNGSGSRPRPAGPSRAFHRPAATGAGSGRMRRHNRPATRAGTQTPPSAPDSSRCSKTASRLHLVLPAGAAFQDTGCRSGTGGILPPAPARRRCARPG